MYKKSTPLEALEEIKHQFFRIEGNNIIGDAGLYHRLNTIETMLKAFELFKPYIALRQYAHMNSYYLMLNDEEIIELNKNQYKLFEEWLNEK